MNEKPCLNKIKMQNKLSVGEIIRQLNEQGTTKVKLAVTDIDGILRGKIISYEKFLSIAGKRIRILWRDLWLGLIRCGIRQRFLHRWHTVTPMQLLYSITNTFRSVPWEIRPGFFLADFGDIKGNPHPTCPRTLLKTIADTGKRCRLHSLFLPGI
jgi:glutamine synthetase